MGCALYTYSENNMQKNIRIWKSETNQYNNYSIFLFISILLPFKKTLKNINMISKN